METFILLLALGTSEPKFMDEDYDSVDSCMEAGAVWVSEQTLPAWAACLTEVQAERYFNTHANERVFTKERWLIDPS